MNTDPSDPVLHGLALVELVGGPDALAEYCALTCGDCTHEHVALYLAGMVVSIADTTAFPLQGLIDAERTQYLQGQADGGMA